MIIVNKIFERNDVGSFLINKTIRLATMVDMLGYRMVNVSVMYLNGVFKFAGSGEERAIEADVEKLNRCVIKKLSDSTSSFSGGKKIRAPGRGRRMNPFSKQLVNIK